MISTKFPTDIRGSQMTHPTYFSDPPTSPIERLTFVVLTEISRQLLIATNFGTDIHTPLRMNFHTLRSHRAPN